MVTWLRAIQTLGHTLLLIMASPPCTACGTLIRYLTIFHLNVDICKTG